MSKLYSFLLSLILLGGINSLYAQTPTTDSVVTGAAYRNDVWYSLKNGVVKTAPAGSWHVAFSITPVRSAGLRVNAANTASDIVQVYKTGLALNQWNNVDTTGLLTAANMLYNPDTTWTYGAFNATLNKDDLYDEGWGKYDPVTRTVTGDEIFIVSIRVLKADGRSDSLHIYKKFMVKDLDPNQNAQIWSFRYANLDGTEQIDTTIDRKLYPNKLYVYYNLRTNTILDNEPARDSWDLFFGRQHARVPIGTRDTFYVVTSVLTNTLFTYTAVDPTSITAVKVTTKDTANAAIPPLSQFSKYVNTIGGDWKSFNNTNFQWSVSDSTVYFVRDRENTIWRLIFTRFGGSGNGTYYFNKRNVGTSSINDALAIQLGFVAYPNPATTQLNVRFAIPQNNCTLSLLDITGKVVYSAVLENAVENSIPTASLPNGIYALRIETENGSIMHKIVIAK